MNRRQPTVVLPTYCKNRANRIRLRARHLGTEISEHESP